MILYDSSKLTYFKYGERRVEKECEEVCVKEEKSEENHVCTSIYGDIDPILALLPKRVDSTNWRSAEVLNVIQP